MLSERLTALCTKEGLYAHWVRSYIAYINNSPNRVTEKKFLSLGYKQRQFLNKQITKDLIGYDLLELEHALILTLWQMRCIKEAGHYVLEFILKIEEVLSLTQEQLEILGHSTVHYVLESKNISWAELIDKKINLHNGQLTLIKDEIITVNPFEQTMGHFFSLQRLLNFKEANINLLRNFHVARYLNEGYLTLEQIEATAVVEKGIWAYNPDDFPMRCVLRRALGYSPSFSEVFSMQPEQYREWLKKDDRKKDKKVSLQDSVTDSFTETIQLATSMPNISGSRVPSSKLESSLCLTLSTDLEASSPALS